MRRREVLGWAAAAIGMAGCGWAPGFGGAADHLIWGESGNRNGQFRRPRAMGCSRGEVFVIDMTGRVQVFDEDGAYLRGWATPDARNGTPTCVAFGVDGRVLVPDTHVSVIREYTREGEQLRQWGAFGTGPDQFVYPTGIVEDADGTFYIAEYGVGAERIRAFDGDGVLLRTWGGFGEEPGRVNRAMDISFGPDGLLYVADTGNHRVQAFTKAGEWVRSFGGETAVEFPYDADWGPDGMLYAADYGNGRIVRFSPEGERLGEWGGVGRGPNNLSGPRGVAVSESGYIFIADTDNSRIHRITLDDVA